jgi:hypothetical protein
MGGPSAQSVGASARLDAMQRLLDLCPAGWEVAGDRLRPVDSPLGCYDRKQSVTAGCRRHDCRRRVDFDLADLIRSEHRHAPMSAVTEVLRCGHWRGCGLELRPAIYPQGVPLISLITHRTAIVEIGCVTCPHVSRLSPLQVIDFLRRTRAGDGNTGVNVLADVLRGRCPKCGGGRFWTAVHQH